jgi:hypothetical protein
VENLRELRLLIRHRQTLRRLCKVMFSKTDASIYLVPYAPNGTYYFGVVGLSEQKASESFDFTKQLTSDIDQLPKLSLHQSGQIHVQVGRDRAGPVKIRPLAELRGEHVASIQPDSLASLSVFDGKPRLEGSERDVTFEVPDPIENARFLAFVNGREETFGADCHIRFRLMRPGLERPLHVGIHAILQDRLGDVETKPGVIVIAGWDPDRVLRGKATDILFIRGQ